MSPTCSGIQPCRILAIARQRFTSTSRRPTSGNGCYIADAADQRAAADFGIVLSRVETAMDDKDLAAKIAVQRESLQVLERAAAISPGNVSLQIYRSAVDEHLGDSSTAAGDTEVGAPGVPGSRRDCRAEHAVGEQLHR